MCAITRTSRRHTSSTVGRGGAAPGRGHGPVCSVVGALLVGGPVGAGQTRRGSSRRADAPRGVDGVGGRACSGVWRGVGVPVGRGVAPLEHRLHVGGPPLRLR